MEAEAIAARLVVTVADLAWMAAPASPAAAILIRRTGTPAR
ncbi:hypothetical protein [Frankia canadensis]|nr:hypothetical protein [Frankia canadensis]